MNRNDTALSCFHPLIAGWFKDRVGDPTDIQIQGWPRIAAGEHVLITAPTGSGKTLAAFLWAIHQMVTCDWHPGQTRVLYISSLKALNNDIYRNLLSPLNELKDIFNTAQDYFPSIDVRTRSGDTPQSERRRMLRHPPEILITTPESLNLLLSSAGGRSILGGIKTVILDEIHAVFGTKRGVHLITAVDRLVPLTGEFQRIALSATIKPIKTVADFVGGFALSGSNHDPRYTPRDVTGISSNSLKEYQIRVSFPKEAANRPLGESFWKPLVGEFKNIIARNRSTLFFANSRRLCEKLTFKINMQEDHPQAYAHHGSLSREIRSDVEQKLKAGDLRAIVATNSLELGIDIGALDEVALVQSPPSISAAIQRIGRSGHHIGEASRGTLFPTHAHDFLEAAVLARSIIEQDIEAMRPILCPLDVLAQIIVSMVAMETWDIDALYVQFKTSFPFRHLSREHFDLVINMLAGRYAQSRIRELKPRVSIDRIDNTISARKGALLALYASGGMIPDRGYFHLRHHETSARIGELDEEFVWEASIGQIFTLGTQNWKIMRITHNDVFVVPAGPRAMAAPFWRAEEISRDFHFSDKIARFLESAAGRLKDDDFMASLNRDHHMESTAAAQLVEYLQTQKEQTGCDLPHRHHLLIEFISRGPGSAPGNQVLLHTLWGGKVNRPFAMALDAAWEERHGHRLEIFAANDCVSIMLPHAVSGAELLSLVTSSRLEALLQKRLEGSGFFGARFRECAGRALLLTRRKINERVPLWMSRLKSQKLREAVLRYADFPILLESWRTCLQDEFDLENLHQVLTEIEAGVIAWTEVHSGRPSPMARDMSWRQINKYMYMDDTPVSGKTSKLRSELIHEIALSAALRPALESELVNRFELKRQRLSPGYAPSSAQDLLEWIKERLLIPHSEWELLLQAIGRDHDLDTQEMLLSLQQKIVRIHPPQAAQALIVALEILPAIKNAFYGQGENLRIEPLVASDAGLKPVDLVAHAHLQPSEDDPDHLMRDLVGEWLRFYGPRSEAFLQTTLGLSPTRLALALDDLIVSQTIIKGQLIVNGSQEDLCDGENFEILLRRTRIDAIPVFEPLGIESLPLFLARYQGIVDTEENIDHLYRCIEQLLCYRLKAGLWEAEIFPARFAQYDPAWLDRIMQEGELRWIGSSNGRLLFCFESDLDLMQKDLGAPPLQNRTIAFPDPRGRYDFATLLKIGGHRPPDLYGLLWDAVWQGLISNDSFLALRKGVENRFVLPQNRLRNVKPTRRRRTGGHRLTFAKMTAPKPFAGNWFQLPFPETPDDPMTLETYNKDRVRLLLDRYGILFREILMRELPSFRWPPLFRSLRLMELSGEILTGYFFSGIPGLQFISQRAFRLLQQKLPHKAIYWINAMDPASLCGVALDSLKSTLPKRLKSTHVVYKGTEVVLISKRNGKDLEFKISPRDPDLQHYLGPLHHLLLRSFLPMRSISVETINRDNAARSPFVDPLRTAFDVVVDYKKVTLYRARTDIP